MFDFQHMTNFELLAIIKPAYKHHEAEFLKHKIQIMAQ